MINWLRHRRLKGASLHTNIKFQQWSDKRTLELAQEDTCTLLQKIRIDYGLTWEDLATLIGASASALRKWRKGQKINEQSHHRLAQVYVFCEGLHHCDPKITDPALWLTQSFVSDITLRAADLYSVGFCNQLYEVARGVTKRSELLERFDPCWHEKLAEDREWTVVMGTDSLPMITQKESNRGEVS